MSTAIDRDALIQEILLCCKANGVPNDGDIFLGLAFADDSALIKIAQELHIKVPPCQSSPT